MAGTAFYNPSFPIHRNRGSLGMQRAATEKGVQCSVVPTTSCGFRVQGLGFARKRALMHIAAIPTEKTEPVGTLGCQGKVLPTSAHSTPP